MRYLKKFEVASFFSKHTPLQLPFHFILNLLRHNSLGHLLRTRKDLLITIIPYNLPNCSVSYDMSEFFFLAEDPFQKDDIPTPLKWYICTFLP